MNSFSLAETVEVIVNLILSSPLFTTTMLIGLVMLITMIISMRKNHRLSKGLIFGAWVFLIGFVLIRYNDSFYEMIDNFVNNIFIQIFFPNLAVYITMFIITNTILFFTIFTEKQLRYVKPVNIVFSFLIIFLFILTLDKIVGSKISVYEPLTVYSDKVLLMLVEFSMLLFVIWIILLGSLVTIKRLIIKSDANINRDFLNAKAIPNIERSNPEVLDLKKDKKKKNKLSFYKEKIANLLPKSKNMAKKNSNKKKAKKKVIKTKTKTKKAKK